MAEVLVTGGTGVLGGRVVSALLGRGCSVRVMTRRVREDARGEAAPGHARLIRGDLSTGRGLPDAVAGIDAIVHCASATGVRSQWARRQVDVEGTRRLLRTAREVARDAHVVYPSIVGIDAVPVAYYGAKRAAEEAVAGSGLGWTVARSTQFHNLVAGLLRFLHRGRFLFIPRGMPLQPVDAAEVAERLADLVASGPAGRAPDFGGPEALDLKELAVRYLSARPGTRGRVAGVPAPGRIAAAVRAGRLLCPGCPAGAVTFSQFLARGA